jgi:hypothetical protein
MVKVKIFMEGGAHPNSNPNADTISNTVFLRESMSRLINSVFPTEKVSIECEACASYTGAVAQFRLSTMDELLLIDLDGPESVRTKFLSSHNLLSVSHRVFFMIQTMESWILSQPKRLQQGLLSRGYLKDSNFDLADDPIISGINVQDFKEPDRTLNNLLRSHFKELKGDIYKPLKYGKLKNSYIFISLLDMVELCNTFNDSANLVLKIQSQIAPPQ